MGSCFAAPLPPWVKVENAHTPRCPHKSLLHTHTYTYSHMCSSFLSHTYAKACGPCANYACVCTLKVCLRAYGTICWKRFLMQLQKLRLNPHQEPNRAHNTYRDWRHPRRINAMAEASNGLPCIRRQSFFFNECSLLRYPSDGISTTSLLAVNVITFWVLTPIYFHIWNLLN